MTFIVAGASLLGRDHAALERNRQDAVCVQAAGGVSVGVVCDGCGEAPRSEVGAALLAALVAGELGRLARASEATLVEVVEEAMARALGAIDRLAGAAAEREAFIASHLLATVVGFVTRGDRGCAFGVGDGFVHVDGATLEVGAREVPGPRYPAYALLGGRDARGDAEAHAGAHVALCAAPELELELQLDVSVPFEVRPGTRVAVASDGADPREFEGAFDAAARGSASLLRFLRMRSRALDFRDDASIACGVSAA